MASRTEGGLADVGLADETLTHVGLANKGLRGTVSTHLARLAYRTCLELGVRREEIDRIPGLDPETLAADLLRVPQSSMAQLWELIGRADPHGGIRMAEAAAPGSLHAWDYLFGTGENVEEGCREAARYLHTVAAPDHRMEVERGGRLLTVRFTFAVDAPQAVPVAGEFVMALLLRRIREYAPVGTAPVHVAFAHRAPDARLRRDRLAEAFGTGNIDFDAQTYAITFICPPGAEATGERLDPELGHILRRRADAMLARARPAACWHVRFRAGVTEALRLGQPGLAWTADRMAMSPRTVQRRLALQGSSWREQLDDVRREQAVRLLRDTDLPVQAIACRLGYADARTLRRAFQRWTGQAPAGFRRSPGEAGAGSGALCDGANGPSCGA